MKLKVKEFRPGRFSVHPEQPIKRKSGKLFMGAHVSDVGELCRELTAESGQAFEIVRVGAEKPAAENGAHA